MTAFPSRDETSFLSGGLFILPTHASRSDSIDPFWYTTLGLTHALRTYLGAVDILTPGGFFTLDDRVADGLHAGPGNSLAARLPRTARVLLGDARASARARRFRRMALSMPLPRYNVVFQLHRRFVDCGYRLAGKPTSLSC